MAINLTLIYLFIYLFIYFFCNVPVTKWKYRHGQHCSNKQHGTETIRNSN